MKPNSATPRRGRTTARLAVSAIAAGISMTSITGLVAVPAAHAAPTRAPAAPAAPGVYVVKDGDFLMGIARKLGTSLPELLAANGMTVESVVHPGDQLVVPATATTPGGPVAAATPPPATAAPYTVKAGDSLFGISRKLGAPLADLLAANALTVASVLQPGDNLVVPASATKPVATANATNPGAAPAAAVTYTVKSGDYLFGIAHTYNIKLGTLLQLNGLTVESALHPGATLVLPAGAVASSPPAAAAPAAVNAASPVDVKIEAVIAFARAQLGKPYRFNTAGPDTFDCSGLTAAAYAQVGVWLPHQSAMQSNRGVAVDWRNEDIKAGDLVFMFSKAQPTVISHVGVAINSWQWIHAPRSGDVVRLGVIPSDGVIQAVRRYVTA
jgi:cell wall-associated NlpC family hydrolase